MAATLDKGDRGWGDRGWGVRDWGEGDRAALEVDGLLSLLCPIASFGASSVSSSVGPSSMEEAEAESESGSGLCRIAARSLLTCSTAQQVSL